MLSSVAVALWFGFVWLLLASLLYALIQRQRLRDLLPGWVWRPVAFLSAALLIRLVPALLLPVGAEYDIVSFRLAGDVFLAGGDVYTDPASAGRHPYLPFYLYGVGTMMWLSRLTVIPFVVAVKLPPILADVAVTGLIYRGAICRGQTKRTAAEWGWLYALQPISLLVTAYHGQFDALPVLLLLMAWFSGQCGGQRPLSSWWMGLAILSKTWPVVFLPLLVWRLPGGWRQWAAYGLVALLIPAAATWAYVYFLQTDPQPMLRRALLHSGVSGYWGISGGLALINRYSDDGLLAAYNFFVGYGRYWLLATAAFVFWHTRRQDSLNALTTLLVAILAITPGMGLQWLLWVVAPAILAGDRRGLNWFTVGGVIYLGLQLFGYHMDSTLFQMVDLYTGVSLIIISSFPAWIATVGWLLYRLFVAPVDEGSPTEAEPAPAL
jgi:hypothetical protein